MSSWQPIETLPLETTVLVWFPDLGVEMVYGELEDDWISYYIDDHKHGPYLLRGWNQYPTHWMELPNRPEL